MRIFSFIMVSFSSKNRWRGGWSGRPPMFESVLLDDVGDRAGADGAATLTNRESQTLLHRDRGDEVDGQRGVVSGHDHLGAFRELRGAGDVGRAEVELRTIAIEERGVTPALFLGQDVDLGLELRVGSDRARLGQNLTALDVLTLDAAEQETDVVARLTLIEQLAEHLDAGDDLLLGGTQTDDLDFLADLDHTALDTTGDDRAAAGDGEDVLDRHQERLVDGPLGNRNVAVHGVHELDDLVGPLVDVVGSRQGVEGGGADEGNVIAGKLVAREQLADFE